MTTLLHKELTGTLIGVYYDVYNNTSRGYPEDVYETAMAHDLRRLAIKCQRQLTYQVFYKDVLVGEQCLDLFVGEQVVAELKVAPKLTRLHKAQALSYLKATDRKVAILFNFGGVKPEFQRLYFRERGPANNDRMLQQAVARLPEGYLYPKLTWEIIGALFEVHNTLGPGFIQRIYVNACYRELQLRGVQVKLDREFEVVYHGAVVGKVHFSHLLIEGRILLFPVATTNLDHVRLNNLKDWMRKESVSLGILANFYPESLDPIVLRA